MLVNMTRAVAEVIYKTGRSEYIVYKKIAELEKQGTITIREDPGNKLKRLVSDADIQKVIDALTIKEE